MQAHLGRCLRGAASRRPANWPVSGAAHRAASSQQRRAHNTKARALQLKPPQLAELGKLADIDAEADLSQLREVQVCVLFLRWGACVALNALTSL